MTTPSPFSRFRMLSFRDCWCALGLLVAACASSPAAAPTAELTPERLYPMALGSAWSYDVDAGDGSPPVLAIARVIEASPGRATMQGGEGVTHYELRPDGIFRVEQDGYLLKAPLRAEASWASGRGMQARIQHLGIVLETPAGRFEACVEVLEQGSTSGATIRTTYCPGVGPVQVVSSMQMQLSAEPVQVVARLRGFRLGPESAAAPSDSSSGDPK